MAIAIKLIPDTISLKNELKDSIVNRFSPPMASIPKVGFADLKASRETTKHTKKDIANIDTKTAKD